MSRCRYTRAVILSYLKHPQNLLVDCWSRLNPLSERKTRNLNPECPMSTYMIVATTTLYSIQRLNPIFNSIARLVVRLCVKRSQQELLELSSSSLSLFSLPLSCLIVSCRVFVARRRPLPVAYYVCSFCCFYFNHF